MTENQHFSEHLSNKKKYKQRLDRYEFLIENLLNIHKKQEYANYLIFLLLIAYTVLIVNLLDRTDPFSNIPIPYLSFIFALIGPIAMIGYFIHAHTLSKHVNAFIDELELQANEDFNFQLSLPFDILYATQHELHVKLKNKLKNFDTDPLEGVIAKLVWFYEDSFLDNLSLNHTLKTKNLSEKFDAVISNPINWFNRKQKIHIIKLFSNEPTLNEVRDIQKFCQEYYNEVKSHSNSFLFRYFSIKKIIFSIIIFSSVFLDYYTSHLLFNHIDAGISQPLVWSVILSAINHSQKDKNDLEHFEIYLINKSLWSQNIIQYVESFDGYIKSNGFNETKFQDNIDNPDIIRQNISWLNLISVYESSNGQFKVQSNPYLAYLEQGWDYDESTV